MSKATNKAATKRNNRKIHARKFLATPEGKAWLAKKQEVNRHGFNRHLRVI